MVRTRTAVSGGPGRIAPARLFWGGLLAASAVPATAAQPATAPAGRVPAQAPAQAQAQAQAPVVPDTVVIHKLVWSTMAALDQAIQTGNYSVLRDLGSPSFQTNNSAAALGGAFAALRNQNVDLGYTLVTTPVFQFPPGFVQSGLLRVRGIFPLRPNAIGFDLLFQNINGQWRLFALAVVPLVAQTQQAQATKR